MKEDETRIHPADIADQLERLPVEEAQQEFRDLPRREGAAVLAELDKEAWPTVLADVPPQEIAGLLREMPHNEAAAVLSSLDPEIRVQVLDHLPASVRRRVANILTYEPHSAGGIMSDQFIALPEHFTIEQAQQYLRRRGESGADHEVAYLYVVDKEQKLKGIISIHDLVFRPPQKVIGEILKPEVKHVWVDDDQEKIAQLFDHYHYMALPVLERDGRLAGIVQANQVVEVIRQEATEDMQLMVGLSGEERARSPWAASMRRRLPWLCVNIVTAFLAGAVVGVFEETIAAWTALAIFLPIVAGQGGNAGAQTLTVIIRDLALGEISPGEGKMVLLKEGLVGLANGVVIGLLVGVVSYIWKGNFVLGAVVGAAMLLNMIAAALAGVLVPYTLRAANVDPALASSIIVTTVTDIAGFFFFLGLATLARGFVP